MIEFARRTVTQATELDDMRNDDISSLLFDAEKIANGKIDVSSLMRNKILIPIFFARKFWNFLKRYKSLARMGGKHMRNARSQIKLFHKFGHELTIMSPPSPVANEDIDARCRNA